MEHCTILLLFTATSTTNYDHGMLYVLSVM